jgi:hypothetical protein
MAEQRRFKVELVLANAGTATATNVDLSIAFPPEVIVCTDEDLPARPEPPEPPPLVPGQGQVFARRLLDKLDLSRLMPHSRPSTVVDPEAGTVTFHAANLKHGNERPLLPFWIRFPIREAVSPFSAQYKVSVNESIDAAVGEMHFVVQVIENGGGQE